MAIKTRKQRMTDIEHRTMTPHGAIDFEVIDYIEMKPGISVLTYKYTSTSFGHATTTRWAAWCNDHALSGGVLHTDYHNDR